jgi:hypothetical protein
MASDILFEEAKKYVIAAFPDALCLLVGRVSGIFRVYRDASPQSTSYLGSGKTLKAAWLEAAQYVAAREAR